MTKQDEQRITRAIGTLKSLIEDAEAVGDKPLAGRLREVLDLIHPSPETQPRQRFGYYRSTGGFNR